MIRMFASVRELTASAASATTPVSARGLASDGRGSDICEPRESRVLANMVKSI
jgi:hypothetical protein